MPNLADREWGLFEITSRIYELYNSHENRSIGTEDLLAGNFPPLLLSYFASLNSWTEFMGLVLLSGFCPCALAGLSPSELSDRNMPEQKMDGIYEEWYGGRYAGKWELPGHPTAKRILEQVSCDKNPKLLRLDGLTLSDKTLMEDYFLTRQPPHIECYDANIHGQLLQQFHRRINILLLKWIEYKDANDWQVPRGENVFRLPPSEFVRFAEKIKFDIPWLDFAEVHFPHLLPEESTGKPTPATEDRVLGGEDGLPYELQHKLGLLKHSYKKFWEKKDQNQRETQPNNEEVSSWITEQGISKRQADALASFIRPEWARTERPQSRLIPFKIWIGNCETVS